MQVQPPATIPPNGLLARLHAGGDDAFEELVREHLPRMLKIARRFFRNENDAYDALQDAFICVFKSIDQIGSEPALPGWLRRITINACLMRLRSRARRPERFIDDLLPQFFEDGHHRLEPAGWDPAALDQLQQSETRAFVRDAIDELPDSYKTVLLLRDIEGFDTIETASMLDTSVNAVKVRLHRARQALRALIDTKFKYNDPVNHP